MKIRLLGQRNKLGAGTHFSGMVDALRGLGGLGERVEEVDLRDANSLAGAIRASSPDDVNVWFWNDRAIEHIRGRHVLWGIFEADQLAVSYVNALVRHAAAIWVPSAWAQAILVAHGVPAGMIDVIREGVDPLLCHPFLKPIERDAQQPFRFLALGKYEARKGYSALLEGFRLAFDNDPSVQLVLKADYFLQADARRQPVLDEIGRYGITNVETCWGQWPAERVAALYRHADAFVTTSRAEGWGLPIIEAAAMGLPLVSTVYSGHAEFLQHILDSIAVIPHRLVPIEDPEFLRFWPADPGQTPRWADVSADDVAVQLRRTRDEYPERRIRALVNAITIRQRFSWSAAADRALIALQSRGWLSA